MKVIILGGNGFIGSNLSNYLTKQTNMDVFSFDMNCPPCPNPNVTYLCGDFFDGYVLKNAIKGMDIVIHAISSINPGNSNEKYILGYKRDLVQTVKLCEYVQEAKCKMLFLSSGGTVYGIQKKYPVDEETPTVPINHYGNLKLCIENTIRTFNYQMEQKMVIARIANPYGPGQNYLRGVGFIDAALNHAIGNEIIEIWGDGNIVRDYIYIEDLCKMLCALITYNGQYEVFNLSSCTGKSQNDILKIIKKIKPDIMVQYLPSRKVDVNKIIIDNKRIRRLNDFELTTLENGIKKHYEYILNNAGT